MNMHPEDWRAFQGISQNMTDSLPDTWLQNIMMGPTSQNVIDHRAPIYQRPYFPTGKNMNSALTNILFNSAK